MADIPTNPLSIKTTRQLQYQRLAIYGLTCALSLILFFAYATGNDTLNDDGINYIYAAHALSEGLVEEAKSYRPEISFYRQIAFISSLTGLDLYPSAQLLSLFWQILLASGFIAIVRCFDTALPSQLIALAVFFSIANLNHLRPDIIRGFGFWALQLWAVWAGLNIVKHPAWRFALLWLGFSAAATLYRAEGIAYLVLLPAFALLGSCFSGKLTIKKGLQITSAILFSGALAWFFLSPGVKPPPADTPQLTQTAGFSATDKLQRELTTLQRAADNFEQLKDDIAELMPNKWAQRSVNDLLIGGFIFHVLLTLIQTTNTPMLALSLYRSNIKQALFSTPRHKLLTSYIVLGVAIGLLSVYSRFFISPRYIMLPAILLCIAITLLLSQTYRRLASSQLRSARLWKCTLLALPLLTCLYPLSRQNDEKLYIREAGEWVKTHLKGEQNIYFNQQKVAFYTADYANDSFKRQYINLDNLINDGYQYAVLYAGKGQSEQELLRQSLKEYRLKTFQNSRGRSVNVYKLPAPGS